MLHKSKFYINHNRKIYYQKFFWINFYLHPCCFISFINKKFIEGKYYYYPFLKGSKNYYLKNISQKNIKFVVFMLKNEMYNFVKKNKNAIGLFKYLNYILNISTLQKNIFFFQTYYSYFLFKNYLKTYIKYLYFILYLKKKGEIV